MNVCFRIMATNQKRLKNPPKIATQSTLGNVTSTRIEESFEEKQHEDK